MLNILLTAFGTETAKQLFSRPKTGRKEAIGVFTFVPAFVSVYNTYMECKCWDNVTGEQIAFLVGSTLALWVHLNAKRIESGKPE